VGLCEWCHYISLAVYLAWGYCSGP
jgi:hypothetical protein